MSWSAWREGRPERVQPAVLQALLAVALDVVRPGQRRPPVYQDLQYLVVVLPGHTDIVLIIDPTH